ncbi:hypothetical protein BWI97_20500 [Siphonobacter sp. BAB-5405]|uniref:DUF4153 domain-containing protein n=1 Tax=Siphonobacter sp. BAB-5405 TaxID=1864825 RepID=UPI000C7FA6E9|nr:DUF4153 domain-containing protein [Siphonobacter sp. BAB-5405]PMD92471.1 hypothetical protein BWI97_20500 [Siphonobacter sp. BAB-5405]
MALKLPSATILFQNTIDTLRRYPLECVFALIGTIAAAILSSPEPTGPLTRDEYTRLVMMAALGLPLCLSASLFGQRKNGSKQGRWVVQGLAAAIAVVFFWVLQPEAYPQDFVHFGLLFVATHLLVSFAGFTGSGDTLFFWQFNKTLFIRLLTAILYSLVLVIGLTTAYTAVNSLFGLDMAWHHLYKIWAVIFGLFNTLFFLSGIPEQLWEEENPESYPRALQFFSQYILVPLALVYLVILLAYELKILIEWQLPKGLVSGLILGYAGLGLLALLLVYPIRKQEGRGWIQAYSQYFYVGLIPLLVLLVLAVTKRVSTYGITQPRYFLIVLAAWLFFLTIYFLGYKKATIKTIPISLALTILFITYGPQSATSVSFRSQKNILVNLFTQAKAVEAGKLIPVDATRLKPRTAVRMASALSYLLNNYEFTALQPILQVDLFRKEDSLRQTYKTSGDYIPAEQEIKWAGTAWVQNYLGLSGYEYRSYEAEEENTLELSTNYFIRTNSNLSSIKGYDYMLDRSMFLDTTLSDTLAGSVITYSDSLDNSLTFKIGKTRFAFPANELALRIVQQEKQLRKYENQASSQALNRNYTLPKAMLQLTQEKEGFRVMAQLQELSFDYSRKQGPRILSFRVWYFIKQTNTAGQ